MVTQCYKMTIEDVVKLCKASINNYSEYINMADNVKDKEMYWMSQQIYKLMLYQITGKDS